MASRAKSSVVNGNNAEGILTLFPVFVNSMPRDRLFFLLPEQRVGIRSNPLLWQVRQSWLCCKKIRTRCNRVNRGKFQRLGGLPGKQHSPPS